jgi:hypothetical protein
VNNTSRTSEPHIDQRIEDRMSTDTSGGTVDQPAVAGEDPKRPPDKVMRIATMTNQLLDEGRAPRLDAPGVEPLRGIDTQTIAELQTDLSPDLGQELPRLALLVTGYIGGPTLNFASPTPYWWAGLKAFSTPCRPPCPAPISHR